MLKFFTIFTFAFIECVLSYKACLQGDYRLTTRTTIQNRITRHAWFSWFFRDPDFDVYIDHLYCAENVLRIDLFYKKRLFQPARNHQNQKFELADNPCNVIVSQIFYEFDETNPQIVWLTMDYVSGRKDVLEFRYIPQPLQKNLVSGVYYLVGASYEDDENVGSIVISPIQIHDVQRPTLESDELKFKLKKPFRAQFVDDGFQVECFNDKKEFALSPYVYRGVTYYKFRVDYSPGEENWRSCWVTVRNNTQNILEFEAQTGDKRMSAIYQMV